MKPLLLITALAPAPLCMAQNGWTQKADYGGGARRGAVGFSIGSKGYIGTGHEIGGGATADFWEFDPTTNSWSQKANVYTQGIAYGVGFAIGGKGYIGSLPGFWEYDPSFNTWTQKADFGVVQPRILAVGFSIGSKGYVGTGFNYIGGDPQSDFWEYDPTTDAWTQKAGFPGGVRYGAVGFSLGSKGYVGTGRSSSGLVHNDLWEYDPSTNAWIQKADLPGSARDQAIGFCIGASGFLGTGYGTGNTVINDLWRYTPSSDSWAQVVDFTGGGRAQAIGFSIGPVGYVGTGLTNTIDDIVADFWEFDPAQGCSVGSACDDGVPCTINDTVTSSCGCAGTNAPDTDGDGICDLSDPCPSLPNLSNGQSCNDGVACTLNDMVTNCVCAGTFTDTDNDGICDATDPCPLLANLTPGDACDDGDPCTENDSVDGTCTCAGSFIDSDNDGICNAQDNCIMVPGVIGSPCDDGDPCTINEELNSICLCEGGQPLPDTDADGICDAQDDCPNTQGTVGSSCDDGNANSVNDVLNAVCICEGTITPPDSWTVRADLPGTGRKDAVGFSVGNYGYMGTGSNDLNTYQDLWRFDPATNTWAQMADVGGTLRTGAFAFATSSHGYVGEGMDEQGTYQQDLWEYDPLTNGWSLVSSTDPQGNGRFRAVAFSIGDIGYVGTGQTPFGLTQDLWSFDTGSGTWTSRAAFGFGLPRAGAIGFSIGSKGYVGTGTDGFNHYNDFWEYDTTTDTWTQLGDFAGTARSSAVAFAIGTKGYLGTGEDNAGDLQDFHEYDPLTDSWTPRADYSGDIRHGATGFALNGRGYIGTGVNNMGFLADFREYTPGTTCVVGASCDDGLLCTINDVHGANCVCAGTPVNDADSDGVCDENDLCSDTPVGEVVNTDGCSCSQLIVDDGDPCTVDDCVNGIVTHVLQNGDEDLDGVCDGADACANTPTGEAVNAFGCACSEQTVDDGNACTVDDCLNGVVTHILIDADADGVCDTDDACPGTAIGEVVSAAGCACAQLPTVCFDGACAAGQLVVGVNGPYSNVGASVQTGEPQPPTGSCNNQLGWCFGQAPSHSVWFSFVAPPSGKISLNFGTTNTWDSQIALWSAPDCNALLTGGAVLVAANDDYVGTPPYPYDAAIAPVCVTAGATYYVQVDGYNATTFDNFQLVLVEEVTQNCDDGIACTVDSYNCGTAQCTHVLQDADGDGICDSVDPCPLLANLVNGNTCDDGNACTINDVVTNCACAGTISPDTDNDGVCDNEDNCPMSPGQLGSSCNDGDPCTINDLLGFNCICAGTFQDADGDGVCDANDNCPNTPGQIGSPCTDNNANTINDALNASCVCLGTPVVVCTNDLQLVFQTDGVSTIGWELHQQGTGTLMQSGGGPYPASPNYMVTTCLPNGNYYLVVSDDGCNGIANGGYILRTVGGATLIDNRNNFLSGCTSQIAGGEGFTLPVGADRLVFTSCDKLDWRTDEYIVATDNSTVTDVWNNFPAGSTQRATSGYEMWWYNPNGGYTFRRFQSHATTNGMTANAIRACHFKINSWSGNQLQNGVLYNVKVRSRVIGTNTSWGPACRFILDPVRAQCPLTHLMDMPGNQYLSCGATRAVGSGAANLVHARVATRVINNVSTNANKYQFRFRIVNEGVSIVKTSNTGQYWVNTSGLAPCKQYEVEVRASFDNGATYCDAFAASNPYAPSWGRLCTLYTSGCPSGNGGGQNMLADGSASTGSARQLVLYPNPNNGEQLFLSIDQVSAGVEKVNVDIYDTFGKRVSARTIAVAGGRVNGALELNGELAAGMYVVNITAGDDIYTERLVIQP